MVRVRGGMEDNEVERGEREGTKSRKSGFFLLIFSLPKINNSFFE